MYEPSDPYSTSKGGWPAKIRRLLDEGWRVCYTDGTSRQGHIASAVVAEDRRGNPNLNSHSYLGEEATVADAERQALVLALKIHWETSMLAILSDSTSAISAAVKISQGSERIGCLVVDPSCTIRVQPVAEKLNACLKEWMAEKGTVGVCELQHLL